MGLAPSVYFYGVAPGSALFAQYSTKADKMFIAYTR